MFIIWNSNTDSYKDIGQIMTDRLQSEAKIAAATEDKENELAQNGFENNQDRENTKNDTNTYMGKF